MKDIINSEVFKNLPAGWQVFFGIIITFVFVIGYLLSFKGARAIIMKFFVNMLHFARQEKLLMHPIFSNRNYYYGLISSNDFNEKEKTYLFELLTKNKVNTTIELTTKFVKENQKELKNYSKEKLRDLFYLLRSNITTNSDRQSREEFISLYGKKTGARLWGLIVESKKGYRTYWEEKNMFLNKNIERITSSSSRSNEDSVWSILNQIDIAIDLAILDMEETLKGLNGEIIKLIKGE